MSFRGLNRNVTKQKLDLLQFTSGRVAKPSPGPAESCGANLSIPAFAANSRTTCQTAFSVSFSPQAFPILCTRRNTLPVVMFAGFQMNPITEDNSPAEREPWLRAGPFHEFINGVSVPALGFSGGQAVQNGGFCLIQIQVIEGPRSA